MSWLCLSAFRTAVGIFGGARFLCRQPGVLFGVVLVLSCVVGSRGCASPAGLDLAPWCFVVQQVAAAADGGGIVTRIR